MAGVPGALRISVLNTNGEKISEGSLDPGYPRPGKVRQALFLLPKGTVVDGVKLYAEIEVKDRRYKVKWACHQKTENDGGLVIRRNI